MWLQRAATAGHADAACNLAHLLANGAAIGGRDDARAAAWCVVEALPVKSFSMSLIA